MKKKLWSVVLSVALAIGLTVPAMALDFESSSVSGDSSEITQLAFGKSSYTIYQDQIFDLSKEVTAYCGTKKICQYPNLVFSTDDSNMVFSVSEEGKVEVYESSGSATVTVKEQDSGKKATCRIVAAKGGEATSFKFSTSSLTFFTNADASQQPSFKVSPTGGIRFSSEQVSAIQDAVSDYLLCTTFTSTEGTGDDEGSLIFKPNGTINIDKTTNYTITVQFPRANSSNPTKKTVNMKVSAKTGSEARTAGRKGSVKVEVGKTVDLNDYVAFNSSANYGKECDFSIEAYDDRADTSDYAVLADDGHTLLGVAVGKSKAVAKLVNGYGNEVSIPIEVTAKNSGSTSSGSDTSLSVSPATGTVRVGGSLILTAKNAASDSDVVWTSDNSSVVSLTENGTKVTVKGLKTGTAKITCEVDGEEIGSAKVTVSNATTSDGDESLDGSGGSVLPVPPIVVNPSTGDNWFSFLF